MKHKTITQKVVDAIEATGKLYFITEEGGKGFAVQVTPIGNAKFVLRKKHEGKSKTFIIDDVKNISVKEAREKAMQMRLNLNNKKQSVSSSRTLYDAFNEHYDRMCDTYDAVGIYSGTFTERRKAFDVKNDHANKVCRFFDVAIKEWGADLPITDLTLPMINKYYREARKTAKSVPNRHLAYLRKVLNEELANRYITENPMAGQKLAKEHSEKQGIPIEYQEAFADGLGEWLSDTNNTWSRRMAVAAINFSLAQGLRTNEVLTLKWNDDGEGNYIDYDYGTYGIVYLRKHKNSAREGDRIVPIAKPAAKILKQLAQRKKNPFVFSSHLSDVAVDVKTLRNAFNFAKKFANIPEHIAKNITLYCTRHTFSDTMINIGGADYKTVADLMGHSDTAMLEKRYNKKTEEYFENVISKLEASMARFYGDDDNEVEENEALEQ